MTERLSWLTEKPFSLRGLHDNANSIPENSMLAIQKALEQKYPLAINVFVVGDNEVIVFNDPTFERMCSGDQTMADSLKKGEYLLLPLGATNEKIPTLQEVLELTNAEVPMLIEIKDYSGLPKANMVILNSILGYRGHLAITSPKPETLRWFHKFAPTIPRGLMINRPQMANLKFPRVLPLDWMCKYCKNDFAVFDLEHQTGASPEDIPTSKQMMLGWGITSADQQKKLGGHFSNFTFKEFIP